MLPTMQSATPITRRCSGLMVAGLNNVGVTYLAPIKLKCD